MSDDIIASVRIKLQACAELYMARNPSGTLSAAFRTEADLASTSTDLNLLRRFSAEADVTLRETLDATALVSFAAELCGKGVCNQHIPKLPTVRRLRAILKSGKIKNADQLSLVRSALDSNSYGQLAPEELTLLGQMLDAFTFKLPPPTPFITPPAPT